MRILLVGPAPDIRGGVGNWMRLMLENPMSGVEFVPYFTLRPDMEMTLEIHKRRHFNRAFNILRNIVHVSLLIKNIKNTVKNSCIHGAHVCFSVHGSFYRKRIVTWRLKRLGVPYLLHARGGDFDCFYEKSPSYIKEKIAQFISDADGFISLSNYWHSFYCDVISGKKIPKMYVLPNPVIVPKKVDVNKKSGKVIFIFLGRMGERKGSDRAIIAFSRLPESVRLQAELWLAGDGEVEGMRKLASELGLGSEIKINDWIDVKERERWLSEADVLILPTRNEGLPNSILEAIAWGLPVITTPVGGIPDVITNQQEGLLLNPYDIDAISQALRLMIEHPQERRRMAQLARQRAFDFALPQYQSRLYCIYNELFGN